MALPVKMVSALFTTNESLDGRSSIIMGVRSVWSLAERLAVAHFCLTNFAVRYSKWTCPIDSQKSIIISSEHFLETNLMIIDKRNPGRCGWDFIWLPLRRVLFTSSAEHSLVKLFTEQSSLDNLRNSFKMLVRCTDFTARWTQSDLEQLDQTWHFKMENFRQKSSDPD